MGHLWATNLMGVSSMKLHRDPNITQKAAEVYTDEHRSGGSPTTGRSFSQRVCSGSGPHERQGSFWATLKRGHHGGTFHHISPEHLHRNEFACCHSLGPQDTEQMMPEFCAALTGKRLVYKELIAG